MKEIFLAIDCGETKSGIIIMEDEKLVRGDNLDNEDLFTLIDTYTLFSAGVKLLVIYEDIRPYTSRFSMQTINTCKMIGRLEYVLKQRNVIFEGVPRSAVKEFVFNTYFGDIVTLIEQRIAILAKKAAKKNEKVKNRKPSFHYVNDRMVQLAMRKQWKQKKPKPGHKNQLGIRSHGWQALGVLTYYLKREHLLPID